MIFLRTIEDFQAEKENVRFLSKYAGQSPSKSRERVQAGLLEGFQSNWSERQHLLKVVEVRLYKCWIHIKMETNSEDL